MNPVAVTQAETQLAKVASAVAAMEVAKNFADLESAWSDFLLAANRIYTKLEQGAKTNGSSTGWFGRRKHVRRRDPLLRYIRHARNADEHGLAPVTERHGGSLAVCGRGAYRLDANLKRGSGWLSVTHLDGEPPTVEVTLPHVRLVRVRSLQRDWFDPPKEHFGRPLTDEGPLNVARLGLAYLTAMVADAAKLPSAV